MEAEELGELEELEEGQEDDDEDFELAGDEEFELLEASTSGFHQDGPFIDVDTTVW